MNRLVIVGNGFDLAHGLPTSYSDFINDYWKGILAKLKENIHDLSVTNKIKYVDDILNIYLEFGALNLGEVIKEIDSLQCYKSLNKFIKKFAFNAKSLSLRNRNISNKVDDCKIFFKNRFFNILCDIEGNKNWVDIENEYYKLLKECLGESDNLRVKKLNQEFEQVKNLLEEYLHEKINSKYDFNYPNEYFKQMLGVFEIKFRYLNDAEGNDFYLKEFPKTDHDELVTFDNILAEASKSGIQNDYLNDRIIVEDILFLNFNYTKTVSFYNAILNEEEDFGKTREIQIHGKLHEPSNMINFGFGDEMDDAYKKIENKDDNEYLKNIKSFQYLQNSNYKDMLDFIEDEKFQVYIMGHSCGLSDRILLNKIFEHHNCRSIKVFYYKNGEWDNYTEIVQNISRHFNKKEMMREKIVNKSLCQPLPQNIRFTLKENSPQ